MANMQRRSPGEVGRFSGSALISTDLPSYAVDTGQASRVLADAAGSLSGALSKLADKARQREAVEDGLPYAQRQAASYLQARAVEQQAAGAGNSSYRDAIASIESRGSGDYTAIGPQNSKMGRALGRYQIMETNIGPWSKAALGRSVSVQEFMDPEKGPAIQDAIFDHVFGGYVQKYGAEGAAQAWFAGPGGVGKTDRKDVLGTDVGSYGKKFLSALGQAPSAASEAKANTYQVPVLSTEPLALRKDGTIYGEAFDDAVMSAWSWRMQAGLSTDLYNAQQQFQDDPAGFQAASEKIRQTYQENIDDPQMQETFDKAFFQRTEAYRQDVATRHEARLRQQQEADYASGLAARQIDIERQAQVLGANPKGDEILSEQVRTTQLSIDAAVRSGTLTPAQGEKAKIGIATTAARGRIQGVFDALESPDQKEQYSLGLLEEWKEGKGPLAALPFSDVKAMSDTLRRDAIELRNQYRTANKIEAETVSALVDDDVASIAATGKGLDPTETNLTADRVKALLGEDGERKWQAKRNKAGKLYDATSGFAKQPEAEIAERLALIKPVPGTPGYSDADDIYQAAVKHADAVLKARANDPLQQAADAGIIDLQPIDVSSLETVAASLQKRNTQVKNVASVYDISPPLFTKSETNLLKAQSNSTDAGIQATAMTQLDFLASRDGLFSVKQQLGDDVVTKLQDWQGRLRYMTPEEMTSWLKQKADPVWQERVKPLVSKGEGEARKVSYEEVMKKLDTSWLFASEEQPDPAMKRMLMNDFVTLVGDRYASTENMATAQDQAIERMRKVWGATSAFGGRGGRLVLYPPEQHYPPVSGAHSYINEEMNGIATKRGVPVGNLSLVSDKKTQAAADRGEAPGYLISVVDPKTGYDELLSDEKGRPLRHFFDPDAAQKKAMAVAEDKRQHANDPWVVFNENTAIGPFYPFGISDAEEADRRRRIREILSERQQRVNDHINSHAPQSDAVQRQIDDLENMRDEVINRGR